MEDKEKDYREILLEEFEKREYEILYVSYNGRTEAMTAHVLADCILIALMDEKNNTLTLVDIYNGYDIYSQLPKNTMVQDIINIFTIYGLHHEFKYNGEEIVGVTINISDDKVLKIWK